GPVRRGSVRRRDLSGLPWRAHDPRQAGRRPGPADATAALLPAGDAHHAPQPEGDRVLHGVLSAVRRPGAAPGAAHLRRDGCNIALLTLLYCLIVIAITHFAADRMRA